MINHIKAPASFGADAPRPVRSPPNPAGGERVQLSKHDGFVAPWSIHETLRKTYVVWRQEVSA